MLIHVTDYYILMVLICCDGLSFIDNNNNTVDKICLIRNTKIQNKIRQTFIALEIIFVSIKSDV